MYCDSLPTRLTVACGSASTGLFVTCGFPSKQIESSAIAICGDSTIDFY
jgi:hypothetical protein